MSSPTAAAEEPPLVISDLPLECLVECLGYLEAHELLIVAATCRTMHEAAGTDVLWRALCVREQHGQSLDFRQSLGSFEHPCAQPLEPAARQSGAAVWRHVYHASRQSLRRTICVDTGRGYAKFGFGSSEAPAILQICQPGAECTQDNLHAHVFRRLGLRRAEVRECDMIVAEPFSLASHKLDDVREAWRRRQHEQLLHGSRVRNLAIVDSASLCLFANNLTSGVVVNIGFANTFVVPVLRGHVVREAVRTLRIGGMTLTQLFGALLDVRGVSTEWVPEYGGHPVPPITVARNLKEAACRVHPTPLADVCGVPPNAFHNPVDMFSLPEPPPEPVRMGEASFSLGWERFMPAESLFRLEGLASRDSLHGSVMQAIDHVVMLEAEGRLTDGLSESVRREGAPDADARARFRRAAPAGSLREALLRRVVLSGGSSSIPGLAERLQSELAKLAREGRPARDAVRPESVRVFPSRDGDHTTWLGARTLAGTSTFSEHWCVHAPNAPEAVEGLLPGAVRGSDDDYSMSEGGSGEDEEQTVIEEEDEIVVV